MKTLTSFKLLLLTLVLTFCGTQQSYAWFGFGKKAPADTATSVQLQQAPAPAIAAFTPGQQGSQPTVNPARIQNSVLNLSGELKTAGITELTEDHLKPLAIIVPSTGNGQQAPTKKDDTLGASVKILDLSKNQLKTLSLELLFKYFPNLEQLNLSENQLTELVLTCSSTNKFVKLTRLNLSKNEFAGLGKIHLECFPVIEFLNLSENNAITTIDELKINNGLTIGSLDEFGPCQRIKYLILAGNKNIKRLGKASSHQSASSSSSSSSSSQAQLQLPELTVIDLSFCGLTQITQYSFCICPKLESLNLDCNQISSCQNGEAAFEKASKLKFLSLRGNKLKRLSLNKDENGESNTLPLQGLTSLETLYLDGNEIFAIQEDCFYHLNQLKQLSLSGQARYSEQPLQRKATTSTSANNTEEKTRLNNPVILIFNASSFRHLNKLQSLCLSFNNIKPAINSFKGLTDLETLDLNHSQLESLNSEILSDLPKAKTIKVQYNFIRDYPTFTFAANGVVKVKSPFCINPFKKFAAYNPLLKICESFKENPASRSFFTNHPHIKRIFGTLTKAQAVSWLGWVAAKAISSIDQPSKYAKLKVLYQWLPAIMKNHSITTTAIASTVLFGLLLAAQEIKAHNSLKTTNTYGQTYTEFKIEELRKKTFVALTTFSTDLNLVGYKKALTAITPDELFKLNVW